MIQLDLNNPEFQANLFSLEKPEDWAVLKTLKLLQVMTWEQIQASKGLHWELIQSAKGQTVNGSTQCAFREAAGLWPGAMVPGCACSHFTLITIRPIDELSMRSRATSTGEIDPAVGVKQQGHSASSCARCRSQSRSFSKPSNSAPHSPLMKR